MRDRALAMGGQPQVRDVAWMAWQRCQRGPSAGGVHRALLITPPRPETLVQRLEAFGTGKGTPEWGSVGQLINKDKPRVALVFTGQGSEYASMGQQVWHNPLRGSLALLRSTQVYVFIPSILAEPTRGCRTLRALGSTEYTFVIMHEKSYPETERPLMRTGSMRSTSTRAQMCHNLIIQRMKGNDYHPQWSLNAGWGCGCCSCTDAVLYTKLLLTSAASCFSHIGQQAPPCSQTCCIHL